MKQILKPHAYKQWELQLRWLSARGFFVARARVLRARRNERHLRGVKADESNQVAGDGDRERERTIVGTLERLIESHSSWGDRVPFV